MHIAPRPEDEQQRLATLRALSILDTPPEERFDRITRLAASVFHVPFALVSLVDENRQWFKSCHGLSATETPRDISFCAHAIYNREPLIIPNALLDEHFADNPLVVSGPAIRFYAGCPLYGLNGSALGTLCIIDREPHTFVETDRQMLQDLASWVENEINSVHISEALIAQRQSESRIHAVMESTSEAMVLVSPGNRFLIANRSFLALFRTTRQWLIGRAVQDALPHMERIFASKEQVQRMTGDMMLDTQQQYTVFMQQRWPQQRELELFSTPVYTPDTVHLGRLFVFRDVTRERELEQLKSTFVSHVSHELRSPITAIKGYIDLFVEGNVGSLTTVQQDMLTIVQENTDRLIDLVNDLLDLSRIEAGHIELSRTMVRLEEIITGVVTLLQPQFKAKMQALTVSIDESLPTILGDSKRLRQVFTNLLTNANHYTPVGGCITITAQLDDSQVRVSVQDTGIGLSAYDQAHVFTRFFRAKNDVTETVEGTGLGLTISQSIVELHGGQITVSSVENKGSTFTILLPTIAEMKRRIGVSPVSDGCLVG